MEDGPNLNASPDDLPNARGTLGRDVAKLDAATGVDRDRVFIGFVLGLRAQLYRLPALADRQFEEARGPAFVREANTDDGQG